MSIRTFRSAAIGMLSGLALVTLQGPAVGIPLVKAAGEPHPLYGREILFDVFRGGDKVGFHRVHFEKSDQGLTVRSRFELDIGFLFFAAYTFHYTSEARWVGGELKSLKASVNASGFEWNRSEIGPYNGSYRSARSVVNMMGKCFNEAS